jgi:hypothetical protein
MKKLPFNGFAILIFSLAVSTLIYNVSFYFRLETEESWGEAMALLIEIFGDLSMGFWTNIISITLFRIVFTLSNVNIHKELPMYIFQNTALSLTMTVYAASVSGFQLTGTANPFRIYYYVRSLQVVINFILYAVTYWKVNHLSREVAIGKLNASQAEAVSTLIGRMRYYGVVQIATKFCATFYALNSSTMQNVGLQYAASITSPLAGTAYFFVYIYLQPLLKAELEKLIFKCCPCCKKRPDSLPLRISCTITMNDIQLGEIIQRESDLQHQHHSVAPSQVMMSKIESSK